MVINKNIKKIRKANENVKGENKQSTLVFFTELKLKIDVSNEMKNPGIWQGTLDNYETKMRKETKTYATFAECPGVGRWREIEPPRIVGDGILPVDKTLGSLSNASTYCWFWINH